MRARTLFLSDTHLGFRRARVAELAEFLRSLDAERIVLVGDIVDASSFARRPFWSEGHSQVLRTLLAKRRPPRPTPAPRDSTGRCAASVGLCTAIPATGWSPVPRSSKRNPLS